MALRMPCARKFHSRILNQNNGSQMECGECKVISLSKLNWSSPKASTGARQIRHPLVGLHAAAHTAPKVLCGPTNGQGENAPSTAWIRLSNESFVGPSHPDIVGMGRADEQNFPTAGFVLHPLQGIFSSTKTAALTSVWENFQQNS
jgi:hypothetical protein